MRVAYLYLREANFDDALARLGAGLHVLNAQHGTPDAFDRGYHETITVGFFRLIAATLAAYGPAETSDAFCDQHPHLLHKTVRFRLCRSRPVWPPF